jgi:hypothetical protein
MSNIFYLDCDMMGQDREERSVAQQPVQDSWDRIVGDRTERREVWHSSQYKTAGTG